jgi:hypothetical protein
METSRSRWQWWSCNLGLAAGLAACGPAGDVEPVTGATRAELASAAPVSDPGIAGVADDRDLLAVASEVGLARTPPMGFNDWNAFGCNVSEQLIKETADFFITSGLKDAGYQFVNIDDCWALRDRGPDGRLVPDPAKFPSGIAGTAAYVHGLGLKLGIYGDAGTATCAGYPGSLGHEQIDAQTFADWGIDYLKYDNCNNQSDESRADYVHRYTAMGDALRATGRPIVYSLCEWGRVQPWEWAAEVGNLWRTTDDIQDNWTSLSSIITQNAPLFSAARPGAWNDPDMLEIGNGGMTTREYETHISMWAMMSAPLLIGTDLRKASADTLRILSNPAIIAVDQDRLGVQAQVLDNLGGRMVLSKPLVDGDRAVALYNPGAAPATFGVRAVQTGLARRRVSHEGSVDRRGDPGGDDDQRHRAAARHRDLPGGRGARDRQRAAVDDAGARRDRRGDQRDRAGAGGRPGRRAQRGVHQPGHGGDPLGGAVGSGAGRVHGDRAGRDVRADADPGWRAGGALGGVARVEHCAG